MCRERISIIVPIYNEERVLDRCIESIVRQTYDNLEIILVDDGSIDQSGRICDEWAQKDERIKVFHKENGGLSSTRNFGLNQATGQYIGFIDSDDCIDREMFETLYNALVHSDVKIASSAIDIIDPNGNVKNRIGLKVKGEMTVPEALQNILRGRIGVSMCTKLFAREIWQKLRFNEYETNEEIPLLIPMIVESGGMVHVDKVFYHYIQTVGSITSLTWKNAGAFAKKNLDVLKDQLEKYGLTEIRYAYRCYVAKIAFSISIQMDRMLDQLSDEAKRNFRKFRKMMWECAPVYLMDADNALKDKVLYILVILRMARIAYRLLGK